MIEIFCTNYINKISRFKQILSRNTSITLDRMEMEVILRCTKDPLLPQKKKDLHVMVLIPFVLN